jgi:hypothetical protein
MGMSEKGVDCIVLLGNGTAGPLHNQTHELKELHAYTKTGVVSDTTCVASDHLLQFPFSNARRHSGQLQCPQVQGTAQMWRNNRTF